MNNIEQSPATAHARQNRIAELLAARGECSVEALAAELGVSGMTVRRDLQALADSRRVIRTHGGAATADRVSFEFEFLERKRENREAKEAIADAAAALVQDGQSVMLDSGTTTLALASRLRTRRRLTVITTSLPIASELQFCESIDVILLGGLLRHGSPDLTGPLTESNLDDLRAHIAFVGADAVDLKGNVYNDSLAVGRMLKRMTSAAQRVYAVADSSKIGRTALMRFGRVADWNGLITDSGLGKSAIAALKRAGVNVNTASARKDHQS